MFQSLSKLLFVYVFRFSLINEIISNCDVSLTRRNLKLIDNSTIGKKSNTKNIIVINLKKEKKMKRVRWNIKIPDGSYCMRSCIILSNNRKIYVNLQNTCFSPLYRTNNISNGKRKWTRHRVKCLLKSPSR